MTAIMQYTCDMCGQTGNNPRAFYKIQVILPPQDISRHFCRLTCFDKVVAHLRFTMDGKHRD